jgi:tRNA pseudouridine55 synthase
VYKIAGPTSHDVVDMARKALRERRIGHTGTLDPMAEGLLLLCVGQATRLQRFLMEWTKTYQGQIKLGYATTTYDGEGEPMDPQGDPPALGRETLDRLETQFAGDISQVPPPYSAKKVAGKKLYELARSGQETTVEPKTVTVHGLSIDTSGPDKLDVNITSSTGFYVRSLAHDVGLELGCGGFLSHLRRQSIGPYNLDDALTQENLQQTADPEAIINHPTWIPIDGISLPFPTIPLNRGATDRFIHGQEVIVFRSGDESIEIGSEVAVRAPSGRLLGVGSVQSVLARGRTVGLRPTVVLQPSPQPSESSAHSSSTVARESSS